MQPQPSRGAAQECSPQPALSEVEGLGLWIWVEQRFSAALLKVKNDLSSRAQKIVPARRDGLHSRGICSLPQSREPALSEAEGLELWIWVEQRFSAALLKVKNDLSSRALSRDLQLPAKSRACPEQLTEGKASNGDVQFSSGNPISDDAAGTGVLQYQSEILLAPHRPNSKYARFKEAWHLLREDPPAAPAPLNPAKPARFCGIRIP